MGIYKCNYGTCNFTCNKIQTIRNHRLNGHDKKFSSQYGQDQYLEEIIFKGYKNGFYVDVGAHNGISINNTLYFEKYHNWSGINIEPIKEVYDKLVENRPNDININCAISNKNGTANFIKNIGETEMISGLKNTFDPRHYDRLKKEINQFGGKTEIINVKTKKLQNILDEHQVKHINYLTIDVEGAEFEVIKSINFNKVFIDVIGFENNYDDKSMEIITYLEKNNFIVLKKASDVFMINKQSQFTILKN